MVTDSPTKLDAGKLDAKAEIACELDACKLEHTAEFSETLEDRKLAVNRGGVGGLLRDGRGLHGLATMDESNTSAGPYRKPLSRFADSFVLQ